MFRETSLWCQKKQLLLVRRHVLPSDAALGAASWGFFWASSLTCLVALRKHTLFHLSFPCVRTEAACP